MTTPGTDEAIAFVEAVEAELQRRRITIDDATPQLRLAYDAVQFMLGDYGELTLTREVAATLDLTAEGADGIIRACVRALRRFEVAQ